MGIDYALALIFALTVPGETAASCEAPSEPVQKREGKAPVQAARVPETPDVTVATSMEAPAAGALAVPSCRPPRRRSLWLDCERPFSSSKWQEDRVRRAVVALRQASDAMQAGKKKGERCVDLGEYAGVSY